MLFHQGWSSSSRATTYSIIHSPRLLRVFLYLHDSLPDTRHVQAVKRHATFSDASCSPLDLCMCAYVSPRAIQQGTGLSLVQHNTEMAILFLSLDRQKKTSHIQLLEQQLAHCQKENANLAQHVSSLAVLYSKEHKLKVSTANHPLFCHASQLPHAG